MSTQVDPRAVVDSRAEIGTDVSIGPFSVIGPEVVIDRGTWIGPHVVINGPCRIGKDNRIFQFSSIGEIPQDKKFNGEESTLVIGDRNTIREYVTINRGTALDRGCTQVGSDNWIMAYVHIAHDCIVGDQVIFSNGASLAGHVVIEDHAWLGGFTLVHQFCRVGTYAFCGMGSALNKDVPPYCIVSGNLAEARGLNKEGLKRAGFSSELIRALQKAYVALIKSHAPREHGLREVDLWVKEFPEVARFVKFIIDSPRGVVR
jgi:UDP-N-acetylglucosamine acyltransferase